MTRKRQDSEFRDPSGLRVVRGPGKFEGELYLTVLAYSMSLDGGADEECGSSSEGAGWAGLMAGIAVEDAEEHAAEDGGGPLTAEERKFLRTEGKAGVILFERTDGFVSGEWFGSEQKLAKAWKETCEDLEPEEGEEE